MEATTAGLTATQRKRTNVTVFTRRKTRRVVKDARAPHRLLVRQLTASNNEVGFRHITVSPARLDTRLLWGLRNHQGVLGIKGVFSATRAIQRGSDEGGNRRHVLNATSVRNTKRARATIGSMFFRMVCAPQKKQRHHSSQYWERGAMTSERFAVVLRCAAPRSAF